MDELVKAAAAAAVGALTKAAAEPALTTGLKVWGWIKGKLSGDDARTASAVEADPAKPSAPAKITGLLQDLLHGAPDAAQELRELLDQSGGIQAITQTANVRGDNNRTVQVGGTGNSVTTG